MQEEWLLTGDRVSFEGDENVLELNGVSDLQHHKCIERH
jgi:hypothetical protein